MNYLHGHLEGEVGLWKELEVREKLKDWRISQRKPAKGGATGDVVTDEGNTDNGNTDSWTFAGAQETPADTASKRSELAEKIKMMPSGELKDIVSEMIEKENGYILDVLLKYVQ